MPYTNVPESDWAKMDKCVEEVMAKDSSLEKSNAVAICHESIVGKSSMKSYVSNFVDEVLSRFKAGARNAKADQERMQKIHDLSVDNGASCPMHIFKQADGKYRWVTFSSTAYEDRDKEIVSTKSLEDDCNYMESTGDYGVLRWWHVGKPYATKENDWRSWIAGKGIDLGVCDFSAMHGRVNVESGTFYNDKVGERFSEISDQLSVSKGFSHPINEPIRRIFLNIHSFERSLLPYGQQSNYFASVPVIEKESNMDDKKVNKLKELMGDLAGLVLNQAEQTDKAAEQTGVAFKASGSDADDKAVVDKKEMTCPNCGAAVSKGDKYCSQCGDSLSSDSKADKKETSNKEFETAIETRLKEANEKTEKAFKSITDAINILSANDDKISAALKANSDSIRALQGDLPKSLAHLKRSNAEDNVVSAETAKQHQPKQQTSDGLGSFLDFAVTGQGNGTKPPAG